MIKFPKRIVIKVTDDCNQRCPYCYYINSEIAHNSYMEPDILEQSIKLTASISNSEAAFSFHGGEPLLCGLDYYKNIIELENKYCKPNQKITNSIQTNGILLDEKFSNFFKQNNFAIGVSLDGPYDLHNQGRGTTKKIYDKILDNIDYRINNNIKTGCISVIRNEHIGREQELFDFYNRYKFSKVSFMPMSSQDNNYSIDSEQYGQFLCNMFNVWINGGNTDITFKIFQEFVRWYTGNSSVVCAHLFGCCQVLTILPNGDIYPCDYYSSFNPKKLGTVFDSPDDLYKENEDMYNAQHSIPKDCLQCRYNSLCNGGCVTERYIVDKNFKKPSFYCNSYKKLYKLMEEVLDKYLYKDKKIVL